LALMSGMSCGGGSGSLPITTPPGTYAVAVTAASDRLSHNTVLQVIVRESRPVADSAPPSSSGRGPRSAQVSGERTVLP
jgi:hypothetical protein